MADDAGISRAELARLAERFEAIAPGPQRFARASPTQPLSPAGLPAVSVPSRGRGKTSSRPRSGAPVLTAASRSR
jgi:hypothetical protein